MKKYPEYKNLNLPRISKEVLEYWNSRHIFEKSVNNREGKTPFVFYEGPPSANGLPGIHHVMARTIKDIFCRYKTLKGFQVKRKAGWDTHGLPIELAVEKTLGITKEDIGKKISIEEYNNACRKEVMKYTNVWNDLTQKMGYWVDMEHPYVTYENNYIESVWYLLKDLYKKGLLYKGYTIQPYSPAAGTGLSSHELNQPGTYKMVKDTSCIAMFKVSDKKSLPFESKWDVFFLAWTTTPWTLPSNLALTVGSNITYCAVDVFSPYHPKNNPITVILAKDLAESYITYNDEPTGLTPPYPHGNDDFKEEVEQEIKKNKEKPFAIGGVSIAEFEGSLLEGIKYEQLLPYEANKTNNPNAFKVLLGDFVTTADGTGIVHTAPAFGVDDYKVGKKYDIGILLMVDRQGKFVDGLGEFSGRYVKNYKDDPNYVDVNIDIVVKLKKENKAFKIEKYEHTYPHCWRTDKPILYYPLDSWFVKTTAKKDRMIELNKTINWKPEATGTGRFGNWLENLQDWNLSRSRFWGIPLPIWRTEDNNEEMCIGSLEELYTAIEKSIKEGMMEKNPLRDAFRVNPSTLKLERTENNDFDLHRPYADEIILVSSSGKRMYREPDLIDVWFDSGAMPYAQWHYPFDLPPAPSKGGGDASTQTSARMEGGKRGASPPPLGGAGGGLVSCRFYCRRRGSDPWLVFYTSCHCHTLF